MVEDGSQPGPILELVGRPTPTIDNIDAFTSVGSIGGGPDVGPGGPNGELDTGSTIYFVVQSGGPSGLNAATHSP